MPFEVQNPTRKNNTSTEKAVRGGLSFDFLMEGTKSDDLTQQEIIENFHTSPFLHMVVSAIARGVNEVDIEWKEEMSPSSKQFNLEKPNRFHSKREFFGLMAKYLSLVGECYLLKRKGVEGLELLPIPPHLVHETKKGKFDIEEVNIQEDEVGEEDLVIIRKPSLNDPYSQGKSAGHALGTEIDITEFSAQHIATQLQNHARPDLLVSVSNITEEQIERFKDSWRKNHRGPSKSGKLGVLPGEDISLQELSKSFADLGLDELRDFSARVIRQVFGVPPSVVGDVRDTNLATAKAEEHIFKKNTIRPLIELILGELNEEFIKSEIGERFELVGENVVPEDDRFRLEVIKELPSAFTKEEIRSLAGMGPEE